MFNARQSRQMKTCLSLPSICVHLSCVMDLEICQQLLWHVSDVHSPHAFAAGYALLAELSLMAADPVPDP